MDLKNFKKIHFIGLGGIGVSAVAKFFKLRGSEVSGSDIESSEITADCEKIGITFYLGHSADYISPSTNLVVYSDAVPQDNHERLRAIELNIQQISYAEILGEISKTKRTIAVSGTHGKSTVTAMIGLILEAAGFDPTVIVGSKVKTFPYGNLRLGAGEWLVVEGDEYRDHMLYLRPEILILTNLEWDHPDYFKNFEQMIESFKKYIELLPINGCIILNGDDSNLQQLAQRHSHIARLPAFGGNVRMTDYGFTEGSDFMASNLLLDAGVVKFTVSAKEGAFDEYTLHVPGRFNVFNALAAIVCARTFGIQPQVIQKTFAEFTGLWRRFEKIGEYNGATIISDYAHHPTAARSTIQAAREFYPDKRIVAVFQPHHRNRTKNLFNDFLTAFDSADLSIISDIYDVAGRELKADENVSARDLVAAIGKSNIISGGDLARTQDLIKQHARKEDIILIMGAGDIDKIARKLCQT